MGDDTIIGVMSCRYKFRSSVRAAKNGEGYKVNFVSCMNLIDELCTDDKGNSRKQCNEKIGCEQRDTYCDCFGKKVSYEWVEKTRKRTQPRA